MLLYVYHAASIIILLTLTCLNFFRRDGIGLKFLLWLQSEIGMLTEEFIASLQIKEGQNLGRSIFAAAGDSCAYCCSVVLDEGQMLLKGCSDYLHCILTCNSSNQVITSSEDGTVRIWGKNILFCQ